MIFQLCRTGHDDVWHTKMRALALILFELSHQGVHGQGKSQGKNIFTRSGNCQGILKFVREFWNLSKSQGKVREF